MTDSVDIHLPSALWLAKLTPSIDPSDLLTDAVDGVPANWLPTPLATSIGFGGMLSLADVGHGVEPNLWPNGSLPLPGDRVLLTRTGRRVEVFGALEITGLTVLPNGAVRLGHHPLLRFETPVDLRKARGINRLLDARWDSLFGQSGRDRRLLPMLDQDVALCFSAMGLSLEALFAPAPSSVRTIDPIDPWELDQQVDHIGISTELAHGRIADGVVAFHGITGAFDTDPQLLSIEVSAQRPGADLLLTMQRADMAYYTIAQSLSLGETFRMNPTHRHLLEAEAASTLVAVETERDWSLVDLTPFESQILHGVRPERVDAVLRELGFLDR